MIIFNVVKRWGSAMVLYLANDHEICLKALKVDLCASMFFTTCCSQRSIMLKLFKIFSDFSHFCSAQPLVIQLIVYSLYSCMNMYVADKNRLPTRIPISSSVTMTDNDSLRWHPCLRAPMHSCLHKIHVYMHVWVLLYDPAVQYDWWLLLHRVLGLHHAAPLLLGLCQLVQFSCRRVIPSLLENPQFLLTFPTRQKNADLRHPGQT